MRGVARIILLGERPKRIPRAHVRPAGVQAHDKRLDRPGLGADALHDRVVDGIGRAIAERVGVDAQECAVALAVAVRALAGGEDVLAEARDRIEPGRSPHREDAAIPEVATAREVFSCALRIGLLDERLDVACGAVGRRPAGADVAVAGLRRRRRHAEGNDVALAREGSTALHGFLERRAV